MTKKKKITFVVEIGGRTKLGRTLEKMLVLGTLSASTPNVVDDYQYAKERVAYEVFRAALRAGWRRK